MTANTTTFHFIGDAFLQGTRDDQGDSSVLDVISLTLSDSVTTTVVADLLVWPSLLYSDYSLFVIVKTESLLFYADSTCTDSLVLRVIMQSHYCS